MADKKITALSAETSPDAADLAHIVTDLNTSATNKKITLATFFNKIPTWLGLAQTVQTLTGAGAINLTTAITHVVTTGADALTLANGAEGQIKIIIMKTDGGNGTLTPASSAGNYSTIQFNDVGDTATLIYSNSAWHILGSHGVTIA